MIIVIANSTGGVGKPSISVPLATWLADQGHSVILADRDAQQSSSDGLAEAAPEIKTARLADPTATLDALPQLAHEADYVIADGPGSNTETSRALLLRADPALVPCEASMLEVRALAQATAVLRQAQDIRHGKPDATIILGTVGKTYRLTQDLKDAATALGLPLAKTATTLEQIYAAAPGQGKVIWQMGSRGREATHEVEALFREVLPRAVRKTKSRRPVPTQSPRRSVCPTAAPAPKGWNGPSCRSTRTGRRSSFSARRRNSTCRSSGPFLHSLVPR